MYSLHVSSKSLSHFNFKVNSGVQKLQSKLPLCTSHCFQLYPSLDNSPEKCNGAKNAVNAYYINK